MEGNAMDKQFRICLNMVCLSFLFFSTQALFSRDRTNTDATLVWGSYGIGMGNVLAGSLDLNFQKGNLLFSVRRAGQVALESVLLGTGDTMESEEFGFLVGIADGSKHHLFTIATGIARVKMVQRESILFVPVIDTQKSTIIGVPFEIQAVWKATGSLGLGLNGFANFNSQRTYGGIGVKVVIGKLR
jgi:hypothetical protein